MLFPYEASTSQNPIPPPGSRRTLGLQAGRCFGSARLYRGKDAGGAGGDRQWIGQSRTAGGKSVTEPNGEGGGGGFERMPEGGATLFAEPGRRKFASGVNYAKDHRNGDRLVGARRCNWSE